jgi:hypothetical protein
VVDSLYGPGHTGISDKQLTQAQANALAQNLQNAAAREAAQKVYQAEMDAIVAGNKAAARK